MFFGICFWKQQNTLIYYIILRPTGPLYRQDSSSQRLLFHLKDLFYVFLVFFFFEPHDILVAGQGLDCRTRVEKYILVLRNISQAYGSELKRTQCTDDGHLSQIFEMCDLIELISLFQVSGLYMYIHTITITYYYAIILNAFSRTAAAC